MTRSTGCLGVLLLATMAGYSPLDAQEPTGWGSIVGFIRDAQGGVIPGTTVTLASETRGTRAAPVVTSATGAYVFMRMPADTYTVEATMLGFQTARRTGVVVPGGSAPPTSVPMVLSPAGALVPPPVMGQFQVRSADPGLPGPTDCSMPTIVGSPDVDRPMMKPAPVDRVYSLRTIPAPACPGASVAPRTPNSVFGPLTPLK